MRTSHCNISVKVHKHINTLKINRFLHPWLLRASEMCGNFSARLNIKDTL